MNNLLLENYPIEYLKQNFPELTEKQIEITLMSSLGFNAKEIHVLRGLTGVHAAGTIHILADAKIALGVFTSAALKTLFLTRIFMGIFVQNASMNNVIEEQKNDLIYAKSLLHKYNNL